MVLYPGEREWDCDCGSRVSPCEHIAAAAIALGQQEEAVRLLDGVLAGRVLPDAQPSALRPDGPVAAASS